MLRFVQAVLDFFFNILIYLNVNYGAENWQMQQVTNGGHRSSSSTHPPSQFHLSHPHHSRSESKTLTAPPATVMPNALMSTTNVTPCPQPQQSSSSSNTDPTGSRLSNGQMGAAGIVSPALPTSTCSTGLSGTPGDHSSTLGITEHTSSGQTLHIQCGFCTGTCRIDVSLLTASEWTALTSPDRHKGIQWKCSDCQQRNPLLSIEQQLQSMSQQLLALISTVDTLVTTCAQRNSQLYANVSVTDVENSIPVNFCRPPPTSAPLNSTIMSSNNKSRALRTLPLDFTPIIDKKAMGGCNIGHSQPSYLLNNHIQIQQAQQNLNAIVDITNDGSESVYSDPAEVIEAMPQHVHIYMDSGDDASAAQYSSDRVISGREARLLLQTPVLCPDHEKNTNRLQSRNQSLHLLSNNLSIDANRPNTLKSQSCDDQSHHHHHHYTTTSTATASTPPLDPNTEPELEQILHCRLIIPPPSIPLKEYLPCVLSHIESPNEFYVHVTDEEVNNAIDDLSEQLSNCYGNGREYPFSSIPNHMLTEKLLGRYLAAFYPTDQNWYRVRVLHVHPNLRTCTVQYVDYGNTEQLSVDDLNYLRPELADTPELAIRCSLAYVQPPTDQDEVGKWIEPNGWSEEQTLCFQGVSGFDREQVVTAHVLEVTTTPLMKVDVLLWNNSGPEGSGSRDVLINLWMVRQGMAHSDRFELLEEVERCANQSLNAPAFFESEADTISSDPPNHPPPPLPSIVVRTPPLLQTPSRSKSPPPPPPASAPIDTKAPDCPDSPIRGQWSSLDASNFRSDYSKVDVPSVGCLPPFIAPYPTHQLKIGRTVFMKITHADSPHQFYGVLPFGSVSYDRVNVETEKQLMERLKAAPESLKYRELCLQMKSFYSNASIPVDGTNLKPGNLVVVQHDEVFARARILSINEPESNVQLRCVDSGRRLTAALNCIFKIDAQFTELPEFSMRCSMPNIEPINPVHGRRVQHWSEQTRQAFSWYTVNNIFLANILRVTEEGHLVQVELLNIFEEQENVDDHMINRRLAQKVAEELQVKVPESVADSSEESVLDAATASCSVTDQATGFTTASVTESVDPVDPADRTQNSSFEVE